MTDALLNGSPLENDFPKGIFLEGDSYRCIILLRCIFPLKMNAYLWVKLSPQQIPSIIKDESSKRFYTDKLKVAP